MKKIFSLFSLTIITVFVGTSFQANAQQNTCRVNGCGPDGVLGQAIPDKYQGLFGICHFKKACDKHDKCYSNCLKCSRWHGTERCKEKRCWFRFDNTFKKKCDEALYQNITLDNKDNEACESFAFAYKIAVKLLGCGYYYGQTFSASKQLNFKRNFDAIMRYHQYHKKNNLPLDLKSLDAFTEQLSHSPAVEQNNFDFSIVNGAPTLSVEPLNSWPTKSLGPTIRAPSGDAPIRKFINGIEVTKMQDAYSTFSETNMPTGSEPFSFSFSIDIKQGTDVKALDSPNLNYQKFKEFNKLELLEK